MPKLDPKKAEAATLIGYILGAAERLSKEFSENEAIDIMALSRIENGVGKLSRLLFNQTNPPEKRK